MSNTADRIKYLRDQIAGLNKELQTEESNRRFEKLPKAAQRVAIARDVIAQLLAKKLKADSGTYFRQEVVLPDVRDGHQVEPLNLKDVRAAGGSCTVCALGAVYACTVDRVNQETVNYVGLDVSASEPVINLDQKRMHEYLAPYFKVSQLVLIESAFERSASFALDEQLERIGENTPSTEKAAARAEAFGKKYRGDKSRLIAIMENIIKNKGTFRP